MVMRYVHGDGSARDRCAGWVRSTARRAAAIVADVGDALDALHRAGYVHRDVKPRNVLIARDGHVYPQRLRPRPAGVAAARGATGAGDCVGTADYVAPEQIRGGPTDARTDVYGLGCLLYFALTGAAPYARDNDGEKLWAHLHEPPPSPSRLCPGCRRPMDVVVRSRAGEGSRRSLRVGGRARPRGAARRPWHPPARSPANRGAPYALAAPPRHRQRLHRGADGLERRLRIPPTDRLGGQRNLMGTIVLIERIGVAPAGCARGARSRMVSS